MEMFKTLIYFSLLFIIYLGFPAYVIAAPPTNFQTTQIIGSNLDGPSAFEFAPDGRIFILQRTGEVKIYKNNQLLGTNFVTLPSIASGDRGLIGLAFDPNFNSNHLVYFYYTGLDKLNHLVRLNATTDIGSAQTEIFKTVTPSEELHVGGTVRFGPDGKLYFAVGDNGYGPNAQDLSNAHGKILRINTDGTIPTDNPFFSQSGKLAAIWAYGLRNPWRFVFDSANGNLFVGDVGADSWEEINQIVRGGNYGWPTCEGKCIPTNPTFIDPIFTYDHTLNGNYQSSAVTQGPIYHGAMFPSTFQNNLFYGDYARGIIRRLTFDGIGKVNGNFDFDLQAGAVVDLKTASDGSIYYLTYYPGRLYRITYSGTNAVPTANSSADNLKGTNPFTVHFSSAGSSDPDNSPLTYSWDFGDGTISTNPNPTKTYTQDGVYIVELTVSDGVNNAQARPIVIQVGCPPQVTIGTPQNNSTYKSGDSITINASALDCAGFDINDASLKTTVIFHHTSHTHPFLDNLPGRSNTFSVPVIGEPSPDTWFEIDVTATDTNGLYTTSTVFVYPIKANMSFATSPAGLKILLDGQPTSTPQTIQGVVGFQREINIQNGQIINNLCYDFDHWSDNGAQKHFITTPSTDTNYTSFFKQVACPVNNLLTNYSFETTGTNWMTPWKFDVWGTATGSVARDTTTQSLGVASAKVNITKASTSAIYQAQFYQPNLNITTQSYSLIFSAKSSVARNIEVVLQQTNSPYAVYWQKTIALTTAWQKFSNTFTPTGSNTNAFIGFNLAAQTGNVWIDDVSFCPGSCNPTPPPTPSPTPTPTPAPTATPTPTPTPPPATSYKIFNDAITTGWASWSWSSTNNFAVTSPVYSGTKSASFTATAAWAGFDLHSTAGLDTTPYTKLHVALRATQANQKYGVILRDSAGNNLTGPITIDSYGGGAPSSTSWKIYEIPLTVLNGANKKIYDVIIHETSGGAQPALYIDELQLQ